EDIKNENNKRNELLRKAEEVANSAIEEKPVKQDRVTIYGRYTLAILKEIEKQAYRFKQIPIEPVGKHTCLIDIKWAIAVEQGLGNLLTVMNYQSKIYQNLRGRIEQRILIDNYETARRIMERSAPPICFAAYLINGTEMQNISVFRFYICRSQNPRYFVEDLAEHIHQARKEWNNTERQVQEQKGSDKTINEIKIKCGRLGKKLCELQLIEAPNNSNMDNCEAELSDYDTRIEVIQQRFKDKKSKTENKSSEYR
ncbi:unnamed protein product, partial [Rotaria sp. Silwood1]